jgi:hypothetical protein
MADSLIIFALSPEEKQRISKDSIYERNVAKSHKNLKKRRGIQAESKIVQHTLKNPTRMDLSRYSD